MKRNIALLLALFLLGTFAYAQDAAQQDKYKTAEIKTSAQCDECKERIEKAVKKLDGIEIAELNVETKILSVKYDAEQTDLEKIRKAVSKTGYDADDVPAEKRAYAKLPKCCQKGGHD